MLKISKENRDKIVAYLTSVAVLPQVGVNFMEIVKGLNALDEVDKAIEPEVVKPE